MAGIAITDRRVALSAELDNVVQKRPNDGKWFDVSADKLVLCNRPESCIDLICEIAARFWQWLTSLFDDTPSLLERRIVILTRDVNDYLAQEPDYNERDRFLLKYSAPLNELYRATEKMGAVGKISLAAARIVQEIQTGKKGDDTLAPTATSCLVTARYEDGRYHPVSDVQIINRHYANPSARVSFQFANGWENMRSLFEDVFLRQNESRRTELNTAGYFGRYDDETTVSATIKNKGFIPTLDRNHQVDIDRLGRVTIIPSADPAPKYPVLNFTNKGDREVGVKLAAAGESPDSRSVPCAWMSPGESRQFSPGIGPIKDYEFATLAQPAPEKLIRGYSRGKYVCQVDAEGDLKISSEPRRLVERSLALNTIQPLTYMISFPERGKLPIVQTLPLDPQQKEARFVIENARKNNLEFTIVFQEGEKTTQTQRFFVAPGAKQNYQTAPLDKPIECWVRTQEYP